MPKLCLNMIVKNESHVILKTLKQLAKFINYWVICDTGSTDNTKEIINEYFKEVNIPGELHEDIWEGFDVNRTKAIKRAKGKADYIFIFDADDDISGNLIIPDIQVDAFYVNIGTEYNYKRLAIVSDKLEWKYKYVVHEVIFCENKSNLNIGQIENFYIISNRTGARNNNPDKYLHDAEKMIERYDKEPENQDRYNFYIAQSYKDHRDYKNAIKWYNIKIKQGGWNEEIFHSYLCLAECTEKCNDSDIDDIIKFYSKASEILPDRIEPDYFSAKLIKKYVHTVLKDKHDIDDIKKEFLEVARKYLERGLTKKYNPNYKLFTFKAIYDWLNNFELAWTLYELGEYENGEKIARELLKNDVNRLDINRFYHIENIRLKCLEKMNISYENYDRSIVEKISNKKNPKITCAFISCKRIDLLKRTINSFLHCCIDHLLIDKWICIDDNSDTNELDELQELYPFLEIIRKTPNQKGHSISMNMLQEIVTSKYLILLEDDWSFIDKKQYIIPTIGLLKSENITAIDNRANNTLKNGKIKQIVFNRNYTEHPDIGVINGGYLIKNKNNDKFVLHEHIVGKDHYLMKFRNCAYWPYFSFNPSIIDTDIFKELGKFDSNGFFEMSYAYKFKNANYLTCFFDTISCKHIGKRSGSNIGKNAYQLNNINQF